MPFKKGESGNPNGRTKGVPNKVTLAAKDAIHKAFEDMGGTEALVSWADKNDDTRSIRYTSLRPKIVPLTVGGDKANPLHHVIKRIRVPRYSNAGRILAAAGRCSVQRRLRWTFNGQVAYL